MTRSSGFSAARRGQFPQLGQFLLHAKQRFLSLDGLHFAAMAVFLGEQFYGFFQVAQPRLNLPDTGAVFLQLAGHVEERQQPVRKRFPHDQARAG